MSTGNPRPDRTPVIVAIIGVIGVILGAIITASAVYFAAPVFPSNITLRLEQEAIASAQPAIVAEARTTAQAQIQPTLNALEAGQQPAITQIVEAITAVTQVVTVEAITAVTQVVTVVAPTNTPEPTLAPTATPEPTPIPGLFRDDFNSSIRPEWVLTAEGLSVVENRLQGGAGTITYPSEASNYQIRTKIQGSPFFINFRTTYNNRNELESGYSFYCNSVYCYWYATIEGEKRNISPSIARDDIFLTGREGTQELVLNVKGRDFTVTIEGAEFSGVSDERIASGGVSLGVESGIGSYIDSEYFEYMPLE